MGSNDALRPIEILLVEDSPTDRLIAVEALQHSNLLNSLNVVENGVDAMAYLRQEGKYSAARRPDIVLLDLNLPKKDGREVLAEIKTDPLLKYIPVIILTTSKSDEDLLPAYGDHANSYITKPIDFARFADSLRTLGGYWFEIVTFPPEAALARLARSGGPGSSPPAAAPGSGVRVLLIEDSPSDLELARDALAQSKMLKFRVTHAPNLAKALQALRSEPFDLVVTDLSLPDSHGLETYRQVRSAAPGLAIIVLTGTDDDSTGLGALREGAQDYLVKGQLTPRAIGRAARYAIDRKRDQESLRQSQRFESVGRLAAGVAHDFNNLLTVVTCNADLLSENTEPTQVVESAKEIRDAAERAIALARQLLAFSKQQPLQLEPVGVNDVLGNFLRMLRRMVGKDIRIELQLQPELPRIHADVGMLEQVLLNLAVNARDAMPGGGKLRLKTDVMAFTSVAAEAYPEGKVGTFVRLSVTDTGAGMEPEVLGKIFEPFYTTKPSGQGTGIGLSTVYGIVQQLRGWLNVTSRVGVGTSFEVFLPVCDEASLQPADKITALVEATETILLVEQEPALLQLSARVLRRVGFQVLEAANSNEALAHHASNTACIDVLLTDLWLPGGVSGQRLAEQISERNPNLKAVFTGSFSEIDNPQLVLSEGVNFIRKPYPLTKLLNTIRACLNAHDNEPRHAIQS